MVGSLLQAALVLTQASSGASQQVAASEVLQCQVVPTCQSAEEGVSKRQLIVFAVCWTLAVMA
eukprot:4211683-Amphidinium_carterae.1